MAIELRLLRYFAVVADELHVGNAAARLFISQPALSQQIRALEEQVGLPLFIRHPRGMELTEAGEVLLEEARAVLGGSERLEATVEELRRGRTAGLRIGVPPGAPPGLLPGLLAPLREREPDAPVEVRELTTPEQVVALRDGALDLGLVREPVEDSRLSRRTLLIEPLGASLPAAHPLASRPSVALSELADELFVCFPRPWAPSLHDVLVGELRERGLQARFQDSAHVSTTAGMVAAGHGLTLSARSWLAGVAGIVWRPLSDVQIEIRTAAAWRPANRSPLLRTLVDLLPAATDTGRVAEEVPHER
ncbi:MAG TPA: LysR substrate-binding domain-containing protein [Gaiellaceae bacterium]|nr:LysR substrate-binding domain-containing protein [Gaiellaceae bacterium]